MEFKCLLFLIPNWLLSTQINNRHYRVAITDHRMPEMTGIELLVKMKAINPAVTRILMSAFEIQGEQFQGYDCVHKFLQKPIHMNDLINEVQMIVNKVQVLSPLLLNTILISYVEE